MSLDILKHNWKFPSDEVYIIGTGPNGVGHYKRAQAETHSGQWVIGVNKAIELWNDGKCGPMAIWLCADGTLPEQDWFVESVDYFVRRKFLLSDNCNPTPCFSTGALLNAYPDVPYYFTHGYTLREEPRFTPLEGMLRAGGSISGQAMQLAYWLGAKRIVLVGVDMAGKTYFDGTANLSPRLLPDGTSKHCRMLNGLCQWLKVRGTEVVSLSPTALNVEVI